MAGKPFRATFIWTSIISNLHTQVEVKQRRHNLKSYQDCFLGSEAVNVVLAHISSNRFFGDETVPRFKAVRLCQALMDSKVFEPVGVKVFKKDKKKAVFEDSSHSLYRFLGAATTSPPTLTNTNCNATIETSYDPSPMDQSSYTEESQEVRSYTPHFPVKELKSTEDRLGTLSLSSPLTPRMINLGLSEERLHELWHQQAITRLLQLIELPLLEDLLEGQDVSKLHLSSEDGEPDLLYASSYLDREVLKAFSEAHSDEWMLSAVDCLEFLPGKLVVEVSRGLAASAGDLHCCKRLLYQVLSRYYSRLQQPPLLSNHIFDIHSGISELLVNGKFERALEALQLSIKLQDARSREELWRLLKFMATAAKPQEVKIYKEAENRMAVKRSFSSAIVYSRKFSRGKAGLMVLFMMDNHRDLFKTPITLQKAVNERIINIMNGKDPDTITGLSYCTRVSAKTFSDNAGKTTKEELLSLMQVIYEKPTLSSKDKTRLLGQFYKAHPQVFIQYFGNKLSSINMMLC
ncbi:DEP domain-containing protein 7 [Oryzias latipes]|uniref:DEP domain-containing protein 7 n=1 Tax=Oryzias latipes TaxID=8090 RepID=UPI0005CBBA2D|nr:DEP domain-containing protein 7 [Oryzias latipes]